MYTYLHLIFQLIFGNNNFLSICGAYTNSSSVVRNEEKNGLYVNNNI